MLGANVTPDIENTVVSVQLRTLLLPHNRVRKLSAKVRVFVCCKWLDISHNQLEQLPAEVWAMPELAQVSGVVTCTHVTHAACNDTDESDEAY